MSNHNTRAIRRHCDVAVVGGSAAGLAAALQMARQRRSVIVVDNGEPRNAPAHLMHGYVGHEGVAPSAFTATAREEVRGYGVEVLDGRAIEVRREHDGRFIVELAGGHALVARRVVAATGIVDELPDIDGLAAGWGSYVIHCPFCHGYEVRDQRIVQILTHPMGLHPMPLFRHLAEEFTVVVPGGGGLDDASVDGLRNAGVDVIVAHVDKIASSDGGASVIHLVDGTEIVTDAIAVTPRFRARVEAFAPLGLRTVPHASGLGDVIDADATGVTSVPGVYAAGNVSDPSQQVLHAAAHGSRVGAIVSLSLAAEDLDADARRSANRADWDERYGAERLWSGNPNGTLVQEMAGVVPGRALDVGAGEGADALWLAEQGWQVTASDISPRALDRVAAEAERRGLQIECLQADANAAAPFERGGFDLVCAQYASIPRTPDGRGAANLIGAVAPGGTLLVVSHDLEPMRRPIDTTTHSRVFDPDAYVRVGDIAAVLADSAEWSIELYEKRTRPPGAASAHHVDDVVLRARRHTRAERPPRGSSAA
ncbi:MAG TPA: bifunctional NAD(P)/FAD-dependent oxidoreductase/class I SAM-dependent methyltransferase [Acidimicrobiales bacterium]|jgi:thioredoxin reductase/SAM-dependent methyltransferase|nr:bifunctional NAD(P)/FAD-dependent oxidoreductase/class I SAM-dependent methyltransferase [Acidimicrobiales bacterium]